MQADVRLRIAVTFCYYCLEHSCIGMKTVEMNRKHYHLSLVAYMHCEHLHVVPRCQDHACLLLCKPTATAEHELSFTHVCHPH
jgi:hypothetical protein